MARAEPETAAQRPRAGIELATPKISYDMAISPSGMPFSMTSPKRNQGLCRRISQPPCWRPHSASDSNPDAAWDWYERRTCYKMTILLSTASRSRRRPKAPPTAMRPARSPPRCSGFPDPDAASAPGGSSTRGANQHRHRYSDPADISRHRAQQSRGADLRCQHSARPRHHQPQRRALRPGAVRHASRMLVDGARPRTALGRSGEAAGRRHQRFRAGAGRSCRQPRADRGRGGGHRTPDRARRRSHRHAAAVGALKSGATRPARPRSFTSMRMSIC